MLVKSKLKNCSGGFDRKVNNFVLADIFRVGENLAGNFVMAVSPGKKKRPHLTIFKQGNNFYLFINPGGHRLNIAQIKPESQEGL